MDTHRLYHFLAGILSLIFVTLFSTSLQGQTKLINPGISNSFSDDYVLPDGTIRFIGSEHGANRELFFVDRLVDGSITTPVFFPESFEEIEFNFAGVECIILPMPSGDLLMGINQHDCDYAPYSGIARFSQNGEVVWAVSMEYFYFDFSISKFKWADSSIICVISNQSDSLYFDLDGNEVSDNRSYIVYDTVIRTPHSTYASTGSNLYKLNDDFTIADSVMLEDDILTFHISGDSMIIVSTSSSISVLDTFLELTSFSDNYHNFNLITSSSEMIWIGRENGDILHINYQLQPLDTFYIHQDIQLKSINCINEEIVLGGNYISAITSSVFFYIAQAVDFHFPITKDVAIQAVSVEEPVQYTFDPSGYPWGFNIPYKNLIVNVANTGEDTIQSLSIRYQAGSGCLFCSAERVQWDLDSLHLVPGGNVEVNLGDFFASCITTNPATFCISVLPADSLPEIENENNRICISVDALLSDVVRIESSSWEIFPNPVDDILTVRSNFPSFDEHRMEVFNSYGQKMMIQTLDQSTQHFQMKNLLPGLYLVVISNAKGVVGSRKIILNRF